MKKRLFVIIGLLLLLFFFENAHSGTTRLSEALVWKTGPVDLNITLSCNDISGLKAAQSLKPVAQNNCDASPLTLTKTSGPFVPSTCEQAGTYTNTWVATDNCGNSSSIFTQIITIVNNTVPVISPLPALSAIHCTETPSFTYPTVTVGCDLHISLTYVESVTPGNCPSSYSITRTWTAKDGCGNTSQRVSQTISLSDDTGPLITTPVGSLDRSLACSDEDGLNEALALFPDAVDECSSTVVIHLISDITTRVPGKLSDYVRVRKWNFTDGCGNMSSEYIQNISVTDLEKPSITPPPDVSVSTEPGKCSATGINLGTPVTADNCTVASVINDAVEPFPAGNTIVTWIVTDGAGNSSTATQLVNVIDTVKPTITAPPAANIGTDAGKCTATGVSLGTPVTADNCLIASVTNDAVEPFPAGNTIVTWIVTDRAGNSSTATQLVTVTDNVKPTITAPPAVSVGTDPGKCSATGVNLGSPVTADNCSVASVTNDAVEPFPTGNTTVTWTVTDGAGNSSTATQLVTVTDMVKPVITAPPAVIVSTNTGKCDAAGVVLGTPVTSDNCSVASVTNDAVEPFPVGNTTITWTVKDAAGNTSTATQIVRVVDNVKPTITAPPAVIVNTDPGKCSATGVNPGTPITADNCSVVSVTNNATEPFSIGSTTITWTVTDGAGNSSTATQIVTVMDDLKPSIKAPDDISLIQNLNQCGISGVNLGLPIISDNCSITSVTNNAVEPFLPGQTPVTWKVTDAAGNSATAVQVVTVIDNQVPVITAPAPVVVNTDLGKNSASGVSLGQPVVSDNCPVSVKNNAAEPFALGKTTITWTVRDSYGNSTSATQEVTVIDNEKPVFISCSNQTANTDVGLKTYLYKGGTWNSIVTDNDSIVAFTYQLSGSTSGSGTSFTDITLNMGITTVTLVATDRSGNRSNCVFTFSVIDKENPTFLNCSPNEEKVFKTGMGNTTYTIQGNTLDRLATDNDRIKTINYFLSGATSGSGNSLNGITFNTGETNIKWTATDDSGNSAECSLKVTVLDSNLPPIPSDDHFTVKEGTELSDDVRSNDKDLTASNDLLKINLLLSATRGKLNLKEDGTFTYFPDKDFIGEDRFTYQICKIENPSLCSTAEVVISVEKNEDCPVILPDSFSPNGDGINDYFKIKCIYNYPKAVLKIYSRSGIKVYEQKNYGNVDFWGSEQEAFWDGRSDNKLNIGGTKLASSTYVCILELEEGNKENVLTGTVFLNY